MKESTITNIQIVTNEISIINNKLPNGNFTIAPRFTRNIAVNNNTGAVDLICEIQNSNEQPFPVNIKVSITGIFELSQIPEDQKDYFLKVTSIQILFPYIRNIVSSLTSSALMPPIILPVIDVKRLFDEQE